MKVSTEKYVRKPLFVDAIRVTGKNFNDIAEWCQGEILSDEIPGQGTGKKYIKIRVHNPRDRRQMKAYVGDWVLYTDRGYKIYTNKAFDDAFDEVEESTKKYPYTDGDFTVIGPGCFSAKDESVLNWKGVNYVPQGADRSIEAEVQDEMEKAV